MIGVEVRAMMPFSISFEFVDYAYAHVAHGVCATEEYLQRPYEQFVDHLERPTHICHCLHVQV